MNKNSEIIAVSQFSKYTYIVKSLGSMRYMLLFSKWILC